MNVDTFYMHKKHGSYADALAGAGLAEMLSILTGHDHVTIEDKGGYFVINVDQPIDLEQLKYDVLQQNPGFPYVQVKEKDQDAPANAYDYLTQQALYRAQREKTKNQKQQESKITEEQERADEPSPDFLLYQSLHVLQALGTSNNLYLALQRAHPDEFKQTVQQKLRRYTSLTPVENSGREPFRPKVSAVQAYNPVIGKGVNRPKANSVSVGPLPAGLVDWFEEWLRYIGATLLLNAYQIGDDLKFSALVPQSIAIDRLRNYVRHEFLNMREWGAVRVDVLVTLNIIKFLVNHSDQFVQHTRRVIGFAPTPRDIISGLSTVYFKRLGSGRALINNAFIGMPDWFSIAEKEDAELWLQVIADHQQVLRSLQEDKSEEMALLMEYRDFMSTSNWNAFLRYMSGAAILYMRRKENGSYAPRHSESVLKGVLSRVSTMYTEILNNEGFQAIAKAMREATVKEQSRSKDKRQFKVHYGLFQELKRKAQFPAQALEAILTFVNEYNAETARKREQKVLKGETYKGRKMISTTEMEQFTQLYERYKRHSETIVFMLIAYASCKEERPDSDG